MKERIGSDEDSVPDIWIVKYTQVYTFKYVCTWTCTKTEEVEDRGIDDNGGKSPTTT